MIVRVDDELHAALKALAAAEGRTLNDLMESTLAAAVERGTTRESLRGRARSAGHLVVPAATGRAPSRSSAIASTAGLGSAASDALAADRAER
jgi:predicted transcriptional regulator